MEVTNNCFVTNEESYLLVLFHLYKNKLYILLEVFLLPISQVVLKSLKH